MREICSCSCLRFLPGPAWLLLNKICTPFSRSLYMQPHTRPRPARPPVASNDYPRDDRQPTCARSKMATLHFNDNHQPPKCIRYAQKTPLENCNEKSPQYDGLDCLKIIIQKVGRKRTDPTRPAHPRHICRLTGRSTLGTGACRYRIARTGEI